MPFDTVAPLAISRQPRHPADTAPPRPACGLHAASRPRTGRPGRRGRRGTACADGQGAVRHTSAAPRRRNRIARSRCARRELGRALEGRARRPGRACPTPKPRRTKAAAATPWRRECLPNTAPAPSQTRRGTRRAGSGREGRRRCWAAWDASFPSGLSAAAPARSWRSVARASPPRDQPGARAGRGWPPAPRSPPAGR